MTITHKEDALRVVMKDGWLLAKCSTELKANREVVLGAVSQNGVALQYASAALKADREVVLAAVSNHGDALQDASAALQADHEVVLAAVRQDVWALAYASEVLQSDPLFLKAAIEINPSCIKCILKPHRQQLYDVVSPLRVLTFYCGEALAEDKLTGLIIGLMTLSYHSPLRALVGSNDRPHSSSNLNWIHDVSLKILGYLSVKDIVRLMQTPANVYVKASDGSERPCQAIETHRGYLGLFSWLFRKSEPRYQRTSEDEANKQCYLTSEDFEVLR